MANSNSFAMSFNNILHGQGTDYGAIFGVVTHDQDEHGKHRTVFHISYYQPEYQGGGYGTAINVKN